MSDTAIILSTYGEPTRNTFAEQWMYSYRILKRLTRKIAPIPGPLLPLIATKRAMDRVSLWREHAFTSPLEPLTEETLAALRAEVDRRGHDLLLGMSYEFRRPLLPEVLPALRDAGARRFVVVPMYMGGGDFTDGMTQLALDDALAAHRWLSADAIELCSLSGTTDRVEALADALVDFVHEQLRARGVHAPADDWAVCLGAHGSVQTTRDGVDNGIDSFGALAWAVYTRLRGQFGVVRNGWLNHERGGRWTEPSVERVLPRLRAKRDRLIYIPWGFTTDNAESALEGRVFCDEMERPFERLEYLPCLNAAPQLISLVADRVEQHLGLTTGAPALAGA